MSVSWLDVLRGTGRRLAFRPGRTATELREAEIQLGVTLPTTLAEMLEASDGFIDLESQYECAWQLERIVAENTRAWSGAPAPLDAILLGFGGDGSGDWFCLDDSAADTRLLVGMDRRRGSRDRVQPPSLLERLAHRLAFRLRRSGVIPEHSGISASGRYAEYSTASAEVIAKKPEGVSHEQAAAIPVARQTDL